MGETSYKHAFTLAEVLITLSIIGVVAALTIPSLVVKNQEKETIVQLKKAYNTLSNAVSLAIVDYGEANNWGIYGWAAQDEEGNYTGVGGTNTLNILKNYLNVSRYCGNQKGCFPDLNYKNYDGSSGSNLNSETTVGKLRLADGMSISVQGHNNSCNWRIDATPATEKVCGFISVDVNGDKGPNTGGKDLFMFYIAKDGIIPFGAPNDFYRPISQCKTTGQTCTAWALTKENMNYPDNWD